MSKIQKLFDTFFAVAPGLSGSYPYQRELATDTSLPELLNILTGVGKAAATILGWLWRRRFHADAGSHIATPRRPGYWLPMRTLVEQTHDSARGWLKSPGLEKEIAVRLPVGGEDASDWGAYPERDAILIWTQDMLTSRALNRGHRALSYSPTGSRNIKATIVFGVGIAQPNVALITSGAA